MKTLISIALLIFLSCQSPIEPLSDEMIVIRRRINDFHAWKFAGYKPIYYGSLDTIQVFSNPKNGDVIRIEAQIGHVYSWESSTGRVTVTDTIQVAIYEYGIDVMLKGYIPNKY